MIFKRKLLRGELGRKYYGYYSRHHIKTSEEAEKYLDKLDKYISNHKYKSNSNFKVMGKKKNKYEEIIQILSKKKEVDNPINYVLGSLEEIIYNPNHIYFSDVDRDKWVDTNVINQKDLKELIESDYKYYQSGVICLEEKEFIESVIHDIKEGIKEM